MKTWMLKALTLAYALPLAIGVAACSMGSSSGSSGSSGMPGCGSSSQTQTTTCGPGTKAVTQSNGSVQCQVNTQ